MRCKRCGEILNPGETRCPVCGKTLSQPRKRPAATKSAENTVKLPQLDRFTRTYQKDTSRSRLMQTVTIVAVAAAIVLLALVYTGLGDVKETVALLQQIPSSSSRASRPTRSPIPFPKKPPGSRPSPPAAFRRRPCPGRMWKRR